MFRLDLENDSLEGQLAHQEEQLVEIRNVTEEARRLIIDLTQKVDQVEWQWRIELRRMLGLFPPNVDNTMLQHRIDLIEQIREALTQVSRFEVREAVVEAAIALIHMKLSLNSHQRRDLDGDVGEGFQFYLNEAFMAVSVKRQALSEAYDKFNRWTAPVFHEIEPPSAEPEVAAGAPTPAVQN